MTNSKKDLGLDLSHHNPMLPHSYEVTRVQKETYNTFTLELEAKHKSPGFKFAPGQFNMLYLYGIGEVPISISGDPSTSRTIVHTTRSVGAVSDAICKLKRGAEVGVRGPFGSQWPTDKVSGNDVIIVAGGIGLAPLRPAIYQLLSDRAKYGKLVILYGARSPKEILFRRELEQWRARFDVEVHITVDRALADWRGNVGVITTLIPKSTFDPSSSVAMICGPEIMMRFTIMELQKRGVSEDQIFVSMERNMKCGIGLCGHCQYGPTFICKDGPVFCYNDIKRIFPIREI
jgi:NAD(P)H-flavin reductase